MIFNLLNNLIRLPVVQLTFKIGCRYLLSIYNNMADMTDSSKMPIFAGVLPYERDSAVRSRSSLAVCWLIKRKSVFQFLAQFTRTKRDIKKNIS